MVDLLGRIADGKGATPAQIALAWLLAQKPWIVPIPGTRRLERLEENLGATQVELTPSDLDAIDTAAAEIRVVGDRYPEAMQRMIDRLQPATAWRVRSSHPDARRARLRLTGSLHRPALQSGAQCLGVIGRVHGSVHETL